MNNAFAVIECDVGVQCQNSITNKGEVGARCILCRLAPGNENLSTNCWKPFRGWRQGHPILEKEKKETGFIKRREAAIKRLTRDVAKRKVARKAAIAEKETEFSIIKATKNSGRSNRDGDHIVAGDIIMDTKLQSTRENVIVQLDELNKVKRDAKGKISCLCLRNKYNVGIVVMYEEDFSKLIS